MTPSAKPSYTVPFDREQFKVVAMEMLDEAVCLLFTPSLRLLFTTPHPHQVSVNGTRVTRALGIDVWILACALQPHLPQGRI